LCCLHVLKQLFKSALDFVLGLHDLPNELGGVFLRGLLPNLRFVAPGGKVVVIVCNGLDRCPPATRLFTSRLEKRSGLDTWRIPVARSLVFRPLAEQVGDIVPFRRFWPTAPLNFVRVVAVGADLIEPNLLVVL
jgi:hypothetical protein